MSWLFGVSSEIQLILRPEKSAIGLPGFPTSSDLILVANSGETVSVVMDRFNTYRGPDSQITKLFDNSGTEIPFSTILKQNLVAYVRKNSN